jgi:hypothetical protein
MVESRYSTLHALGTASKGERAFDETTALGLVHSFAPPLGLVRRAGVL